YVEHLSGILDPVSKKPLAQSTVDKKLTGLKTLLKVAARKRLVEFNVAQDVALAKARRGKAASRAKIFEEDDLRTIFSSPIYLDGCRQAGGKGEAQYWMPLIALFSAMRIEEIACRTVSDIKTSAGITYIDVRHDPAVEKT